MYSEYREYYYYNRAGFCNWVDKIEGKRKIVFMGSSTIKYGLNPITVTKELNLKYGDVVNLASDAQTPIESYFQYMRYKNGYDSNHIVVYPLDQWLFSVKYYYFADELITVNTDVIERYYSVFYDKKSNIKKVLFGGVLNKALEGILAGLSPDYEKKIFRPENIGGDSISTKLKAKNFSRSPRLYFSYPLFLFSEIQFDYLAKLIEAVEINKGKIVFLITPRKETWKDDYTNTCSDIDSVFIESINKRVRSSYVIGKMLPFNANRDAEYFVDGFHLNSTGREEYSKIVSKYINIIPTIDKSKLINTYKY